MIISKKNHNYLFVLNDTSLKWKTKLFTELSFFKRKKINVTQQERAEVGHNFPRGPRGCSSFSMFLFIECNNPSFFLFLCTFLCPFDLNTRAVSLSSSYYSVNIFIKANYVYYRRAEGYRSFDSTNLKRKWQRNHLNILQEDVRCSSGTVRHFQFN